MKIVAKSLPWQFTYNDATHPSFSDKFAFVGCIDDNPKDKLITVRVYKENPEFPSLTDCIHVYPGDEQPELCAKMYVYTDNKPLTIEEAHNLFEKVNSTSHDKRNIKDLHITFSNN